MVDEIEPPELGPLRDNSLLWRLSLWGGAATVAMAAAVLVTQTDIGAERLLQAFSTKPVASDSTRQAAAQDPLAQRADEQRLAEARRLEAQVRELAADRDRLNARIAALEQTLSETTGSIKRELAMVAATAPGPKPVPSSPTPVLTAPPTITTPAGIQPQSGKLEAKSDDKAVAKPETALEPKAAPKPEAIKPPAKPESQPQAAAAPPAPAASVPPATVSVPMPPVRVAAIPQQTTDDAGKADLAVDLGGARTLEILNARWVAVKANFGPMLEGLRPLVAYDKRPGVIPYRLIVGPLPNGAAAAHICSRFAASRVSCRATKFVGEQLAQQ